MRSFAPDRLGDLLTWMRERERARLAREAGLPPPPDLDPTIREWRFCNVDRRDDRVTRFVRLAYALPGHPLLWFNLTIARLVNWPPTLTRLGWIGDWDRDRDRFLSVFRELAAAGAKAYTGAYMIPGGPAGEAKHDYLARACLDVLWARRASAPRPGAPLSDWSRFLTAPVLGDFLRNQVLTDIRDAPGFDAAPDWETFVLGGPGTVRGLNRLLGLPLDRSWKQRDVAPAVLDLRAALLAAEPRWAPVLRDPNNLTNCLCEFDKWERVRRGEGKPRARYSPDPRPLPPRPSAGNVSDVTRKEPSMSTATLPPIQFADLDALRQVSGVPALLRDFGLRASAREHVLPLQGPAPVGPDVARDLLAYRTWLMAQVKEGRDGNPAARCLAGMVDDRARLAGEGRAMVLAYEGSAALPYAEVVAKCLDYLAARGFPQPAA